MKLKKETRAISKMLVVGIVIIVIVIAGVAGAYVLMSQQPAPSPSPSLTPTPTASVSPTPTPSPTPPAIKDTLIIGTTDSVETCLDPARAYDFFGWEIIQSLGAPLAEYAPGTDQIVPSLATSWTVSDNGLQWTFNLRQGIHFDSGKEFNADAVKYSFDRNIQIADPDGPFVGIGYGDIIDNIVVVSPYVVQFNLKIPFAAFLSLMASQASCIVDPENAPKAGAAWSVDDVVVYREGDARGSNPMGLGPYTLKSWVRTAGKDSEIQLQANPNYWNASGGYPKTKNINIKMYADESSLALAIQSGDVDIAFRQLATTDIITMQQNPNLKVWSGTGAFIQYFCMQEKYAPFNDPIIRLAIASAINRATLVQTVFQGQAQELYSMIPIGMFGHTDAFQSFGAPNYTLTAQLLSPLGYSASNKLTFDLWYESSGHYPSSAEQALVIKDSLEASGLITVNLQSLDWAGYRNARTAETMQAYIMGWYPDYIDPDDYIYPFVQSTGGSWLHMNYNSSTMDALVASARGNTSQTIREGIYSQINDLIVADCPLIPLYQSGAYAVTKTNVQGVYLDISQQWRNWLLYATG
ncbi:MAG: ABC transporter substrate-binding protein [Candidatus Bathyarchaeia archaeon]